MHIHLVTTEYSTVVEHMSTERMSADYVVVYS